MICLFSPARDNFCQPSGKLSGNRPTLFHCGLRLMTLVCIAIQFSNLLSAQQPSMDESAEQRMKFMQQSGRTYDVTDKSGSRLRFVDEPALRWTNPVSGVSDGGLFFWCDQDGKPHAAAQIFLIPKTQRKWLHEFQSLSESTFTFNYEGRPVWSPKSAGVEFKPFANSDAPRASAGGRLIQMRRIAQRFTVNDDFEGENEDRLRLMSSPVARYSNSEVIDGALFIYAHGTDPELFVVIEARRTEDTSTWHVALAPMTAYALHVKLDDQPYWDIHWRQAPLPVTSSFINFIYPPSR